MKIRYGLLLFIPSVTFASGIYNPGGSLVGGASTVTLSSFTAIQPIVYNNSTGQFSATLISLSTGVTGNLPAANIATGSLGPQVIASSLAVNAVYPGAVSAAAYPNITGVGTLASGVWNGTALTSTYIPTDVVYNDNAPSSTFSSSVTFNSQIAIARGLDFTGINSISASYPATSTDTVISCSASGGTRTITLPSANAKTGQLLYIVKNDSSANACTVQVAGTDLIAFTTGTVKLNAQGQGIKLISDGISSWITPDGIPATPPFIGYKDGPSAAQAVAASSTTQLVATYVPTPVRVTGVRYIIGTQSGNCQYGLYDANGVLIASSTETACAAPGVATTSFSSAVNIAPGIYYLALGAGNTANTWTKSSGNGMGCNSITANLPLANVTLPGSNTVNCFSIIGIVTGGITQ